MTLRPLRPARRRRLPPHSFALRKVRDAPFTKYSFGSLTLSTDLEELSLGTTMQTHFENPDDILNFKLTIDPDEGMYKGGRFEFDFKINQNFPTTRPKSSAHRRSTTRTSIWRATCA